MRRTRLVTTVAAGLVLVLTRPASGQTHQPAHQPVLGEEPRHFESWRPASPPDASAKATVPASGVAEQHRTRRALVGGAIGAAAGVILCTAVSTIADDSADGGLSFCPLDSYVLIGGAGFVVGAVIGWVS